MSNFNEISYKSVNGRTNIYGRIWLPEGKPKATVQIAHGIAEHCGRYDGFCGFLRDNGFAVYINDHLGHGKSIYDETELGFFDYKDGWMKTVEDMHTLFVDVEGDEQALKDIEAELEGAGYLSHAGQQARIVLMEAELIDRPGAIIPVLSLAIPGSAPAAVLLAAFWMHGYRPGPLLMSETPEFLYLVVVSMVFASLVMVLLANNMAKVTVKVLQVDQRILMPIVFICCVIGAFVVNNRLFDIKLMFVFGLLGIAMSYMKYPSAPFLLGVVMGNMADENLRRALMLHNGSILPFFTRPICIFFLLFILVLVVPQLPFYPKLKAKFTRQKAQA